MNNVNNSVPDSNTKTIVVDENCQDAENCGENLSNYKDLVYSSSHSSVSELSEDCVVTPNSPEYCNYATVIYSSNSKDYPWISSDLWIYSRRH